MRFHILNGDALQEKFPVEHIEGEVIVLREAFIDGPVSTQYGSAYGSSRVRYSIEAYGDSSESYENRVWLELKRMESIASADEVYLCFVNDLFCQCKMWFAVDYISNKSHPRFFRIFPDKDDLRRNLRFWRYPDQKYLAITHQPSLDTY